MKPEKNDEENIFNFRQQHNFIHFLFNMRHFTERLFVLQATGKKRQFSYFSSEHKLLGEEIV